MVAHHLLAASRQILEKQGEKFKVLHNSYDTDYGELLQYAKDHPELTFYLYSSNHIASPLLAGWNMEENSRARNDLKELKELKNVWCIHTSL